VNRRLVLLLAVGCLLAGPACKQDDPDTPRSLLRVLKEGCASRDTGMLLTYVDIHYQDDLGGPGRLEDDLRRIFTVYGKLRVDLCDVTVSPEEIKGHAVLAGKRIRYEGPLELKIARQPSGFLVNSGFCTELRGILHTLRERRLSLESGVPSRMERFVSDRYRGEGGGREDLLLRLRNDLAAVQATALIVDDLNIRINGGSDRQPCATVIQEYLLIQGTGERKLENRGRERLTLCKEGSLWRFTGGLG
jgi:hypothetical protein